MGLCLCIHRVWINFIWNKPMGFMCWCRQMSGHKVYKRFEEISKGENMRYFCSNCIICLAKDLYWKGGKMSGNNEKLPYLYEITKRKFLVNDKNMGLCLYTIATGLKKYEYGRIQTVNLLGTSQKRQDPVNYKHICILNRSPSTYA